MDKNYLDLHEEMKNNLAERIDHNHPQNIEIRLGVQCPKCNKGRFDYDGMLNLVCSNCGYTSGGCFT